jgi:Transcriptional regulator
MKTREKLMLEAFKLFASKTYDQVTFADLEAATGLSRGAILYHVKNKESMFTEVIDMFVFKQSSATNIPIENKQPLLRFINHFIERCRDEQKSFKEYGIKNMNLALLNIECNAFNYYPKIQEVTQQWCEEEIAMWRKVIELAVEGNEISSNDCGALAKVFEDIYIGASYQGIAYKKGVDVEVMKQSMMVVYNAFKRS